MPRQKTSTKIKKQVKAGLFNLTLLSLVNFFGMLYGTVFAIERLGMGKRNAYALTIVVLFLVNFLLFRHVVYRSKQTAMSKQFVGYVVVSIGVAIMEFTMFSRIYNEIGDYRQAVITVTLLATLVRFILFPPKLAF